MPCQDEHEHEKELEMPKNIEAAITDYIRLRDRRTELKRTYEESDNKLKAIQDRIEQYLLEQAEETGSTSFKVAGVGMAYKQVDMKPTINDFDAFMDFVADNRAYDAVQKRVNKTFVTSFMEEHNGQLPTGVGVHSEIKMVVRRGK